jgi:hypothetical protein
VDTLEVMHLEHLDRTSRTCKSRRTWATALLPSTRSSTSRRFRCIRASSGNPVISDSSSSCFAGKILFCASVATPFPFNILQSNKKEDKLSYNRHVLTWWVCIRLGDDEEYSVKYSRSLNRNLVCNWHGTLVFSWYIKHKVYVEYWSGL